ncbi:transcriptional regulator GcvA [Desulfoluna spongiiphila]|uniref:LysR family transcriptional regulator, glycine cleavage system transcriptional activator n=1 Tax=Desulfoluna spongiiphila TaxID=419481 RepID=A0A1G5G9C4_9BACT|nr:transcriptional regulator GcvA [Desulfoluna spongiiphila]SCY48152.1 LysR family transcriptional regulator, glycine cleavage system transcriptional activator [Desulfoluna spongiiphila]VVS93698.1 transcription regulator hth lysr [Desulfoluna spongiiphila]
MTQNLPPLNALVVFETVAKHLSFTTAAGELCITQGAVSQQIRKLEDFLELPLFRRGHQSLSLTQAGADYLPSVTEALDKIRISTASLSRKDARGVLSVNVSPSFANQWLLSRFHLFCREYPDIDLKINATPIRTEFGKEDVDVAIRYGAGPWPGVHCTKLSHGRVYAVCSPELLEGPHGLTTIRNLKHHLLLRNSELCLWPMWLESVGMNLAEMRQGPTFNLLYMAIQAAANGQGVALGSTLQIYDHIEAGTLVVPFKVGVISPVSYWFLTPEIKVRDAKVLAFKSWITAELQGQNPI